MCTKARRFSFSLVAALLALTACKKPTEVEVDKVERRTVLARVSESGNIEPDVEVPIASDVSGEVVALYFKEGDFVRRGDLLFEIRPDNYRAALEQSNASMNATRADQANAEAAVKQAEANLAQDSVNFFRNKLLFEQKVIPQAEFENFRLKYDIARAALESSKQARTAAYFRVLNAQASVKRAADDLGRTRVYASMDGAVTKLTVELGQRVVGTGMMSGTEAIKIADLSRMKVKVLINENDIVNVRIGDTASLEVDAYPKKKFQGVVTDIAYAANLPATGAEDQVTNYEVKVLIKPESYQNDAQLMRNLQAHQSPLRPGMSALVNIFYKKVDNVTAIPIQAVSVDRDRTREERKKKEIQEIVYVYDETTEQVRKQNVETGTSDNEFIEVKSGLTPGQTIVTGPYNTINKTLKNDMKVTVRDIVEDEENKKD